MARHMLLTIMIVFSVYAGLLLVIGHPFAVTAQAEVIDATKVAQPATGLKPQKQIRTPAKFVDTEQQIARLTTTSASNKPVFKGPTIVGATSLVNLGNAQADIDLVWEKLLADNLLINNVNWSKGNIKAYAYYRDFSANMEQALLTIGFDQNDLKLSNNRWSIILPTGEFELFSVDTDSGVPVEDAWAQAYLQKNLIERHTLNRNGEPVTTDAIVVKK